MERARLGGLIVALVALPCCSLFVSTSGLVGDSDDAADASISTTDASGSSSSSSSSSSGAPADAALPDALPDGALPPGFCGDLALFCTDFEAGPAGLPSDFTATYVTPGTTLAVETGPSRSPTRALRSSTVRTSQERTTVASQSLPAVWKDLRMRFAMQMEEPALQAGDRGTHVFQFNVEVAPANVVLTLEVLPNRSIVFYSSYAPNDPFVSLPNPLVYGEWHEFDIEARLTGDRVSVKMDGEGIERNNLGFPANPAVVNAVTYELGARSLNVPHPGVTVRYDDVRADYLP